MKTILIVEDSSVMREYLVELFQKELLGVQVLKADRFALGLKVVMDQIQNIDVILTDYFLGLDNGVHLLENARFLEESGSRDGEKPTIAKAIMTESSGLQSREIQDVIARGFLVLPKPTPETEKQFVENVKALLKNENSRK